MSILYLLLCCFISLFWFGSTMKIAVNYSSLKLCKYDNTSNNFCFFLYFLLQKTNKTFLSHLCLQTSPEIVRQYWLIFVIFHSFYSFFHCIRYINPPFFIHSKTINIYKLNTKIILWKKLNLKYVRLWTTECPRVDLWRWFFCFKNFC